MCGETGLDRAVGVHGDEGAADPPARTVALPPATSRLPPPKRSPPKPAPLSRYTRTGVRVSHRGMFFHQFLRRPNVTGAVTPSSTALARRMVERVDFQAAQVVVEYGAGTGVFTREVISRLRPDATFLAFELNPELVGVVRRRFPEARVYQDSAARVEHYLQLNGRDHIDAVISGLPWAAFPGRLQYEILDPTIRLLR